MPDNSFEITTFDLCVRSTTCTIGGDQSWNCPSLANAPACFACEQRKNGKKQAAKVLIRDFLMAGTATGVMTEGNSATSSETWAHALLLLCKLTVDLPLHGFTVADMLRLQLGAVIPTRLRVGADVPLRVNGVLLANGEFEVAGEHLALRLTDLV